MPEGLHPPKLDNAEELLREMAYATAGQIYGPALPPRLVQARLERELKAITGNGYASLY